MSSQARGDRCRTLSGGMRRRVALACALVGLPPVLLLDEPTVGLDPEQRLQLQDVVRTVAESAAVVVSTHELAEAALGGRVIVLFDGAVVFGHCGGVAFSRAGQRESRGWLCAPAPSGALCVRSLALALRASWGALAAPAAMLAAVAYGLLNNGWVGAWMETAQTAVNALHSCPAAHRPRSGP